ncbi:MAG TPA: zf-HC2 domain-containing protein [Candidatus Binatia bacterium]|nr:zf-HC2 domain-containing protein [Candidatus Binatia bacterium]
MAEAERTRARLADALDALARETPADEASRDRLAHPDDVAMALYAAGELDGEARDRFESHVAACARCAGDLALAIRIDRGSRAVPPSATGAVASASGADRAAGVRHDLAAASAELDHASEPERETRAARAARRPARTERRAGRSRLRRFAIAAGAVLVVTAGVLAIGARMALDRLEPILVAELGSALHRTVSVDDLGVAVAGGPGVRIDGLRVSDDPRFADASFAEVGRARLRVDPAALLRGTLDGAIDVDDALVRLVRGRDGTWNVETLGGERATAGPGAADAVRAPRDRARTERGGDGSERRVRITSAKVREGTLEIADRSSPGRDVVLRDVDLDVRSADPERAAVIALGGRLGAASGDRPDGGKVAIAGEVGPFVSGETARWHLTSVRLDRVPVTDMPGAPASVRGELSFDGALDSAGDGLAAVVANAAGGGQLGLCCGALGDGNLARDLVGALSADVATGGGSSFGQALMAAANREPAVASALAAPDTAFENIAGGVRVASGDLSFQDLALATSLFSARASGTLSRAGAVAVAGTADLDPRFAALVADAAPVLRPLVGRDGRLAVPFRASGTWPKLRVDVDMARAVASAVGLDPRALAIAFALPRSVRSGA